MYFFVELKSLSKHFLENYNGQSKSDCYGDRLVEPSVSMQIGTGADRNGEWLDGDCMEENLFAICERKKH